ncbi:2Fe-2S iron-sulfur cluster-binding protein [Paraburkholderia ferrariae]|jgi:2Fe-2S ferredoxin|uniref:2Fe-2S iron-sulfur cluster-binding protein n=1 Tax=Paraburkholderia ferrariae TaxID=386056 RepID=UPI000489282A|nr:2Fe-2S iron-sulfur cluster-binding protein [Paraburkholderia ferrariae]
MTIIVFKAVDGEEFRVEAAGDASVMQAATNSNVPGIDAECGGACACATCHVYVDPAWESRLDGACEAERSMLQFAGDVRDNSRLACQLTIHDALDGLVLWLPAKAGDRL